MSEPDGPVEDYDELVRSYSTPEAAICCPPPGTVISVDATLFYRLGSDTLYRGRVSPFGAVNLERLEHGEWEPYDPSR